MFEVQSSWRRPRTTVLGVLCLFGPRGVFRGLVSTAEKKKELGNSEEKGFLEEIEFAGAMRCYNIIKKP